MGIKLVTWNINSVRPRLNLIERLVDKFEPDIICLQEIKCTNDAFPTQSFNRLGFEHLAVHGQKSYHGVAIAAKYPIKHQFSRQFCNIDDTRHVSAQFNVSGKRFNVHNFYIPAGGDEPNVKINPKFHHKLKFIAEMDSWLNGENFDHPAILVGDFNIAPHPNDVWSHKQLLKVVSHTPIETEALNALKTRGEWRDIVREHISLEEKIYSWWSYRAKDWQISNRGRRLDHIWASKDFPATFKSVQIVTKARGWFKKPSDHVPILTEIDF